MIPPWIIKIRGETHYVKSVKFSNVCMDTKTNLEAKTPGVLKLKACYRIDKESGEAIIWGSSTY